MVAAAFRQPAHHGSPPLLMSGWLLLRRASLSRWLNCRSGFLGQVPHAPGRSGPVAAGGRHRAPHRTEARDPASFGRKEKWSRTGRVCRPPQPVTPGGEQHPLRPASGSGLSRCSAVHADSKYRSAEVLRGAVPDRIIGAFAEPALRLRGLPAGQTMHARRCTIDARRVPLSRARSPSRDPERHRRADPRVIPVQTAMPVGEETGSGGGAFTGGPTAQARVQQGRWQVRLVERADVGAHSPPAARKTYPAPRNDAG